MAKLWPGTLGLTQTGTPAGSAGALPHNGPAALVYPHTGRFGVLARVPCVGLETLQYPAMPSPFGSVAERVMPSGVAHEFCDVAVVQSSSKRMGDAGEMAATGRASR